MLCESHNIGQYENRSVRMYNEMQIPTTEFPAIVHDNDANIVKGVRETLLPSERCFIHILQLVTNDALRNSPQTMKVLTTQHITTRRLLVLKS